MKPLNLSLLLGLISGLMIAGNTASMAAPPVNDNFASATAIDGESGSVTGTNVDATVEDDEPEHDPYGNPTGASVWWAWTAPEEPQHGVYYFDASDSGFACVVAVYTGTELDDLENLGSSGFSAATFLAEAGKTYFIAVAGADWGDGPQEGAITLNWGLVPPGEISVFKSTQTVRFHEQGVHETTPVAPFTYSSVWTGTNYYKVIDSTNERVYDVYLWTEKEGGKTRKYFEVYGPDRLWSDVIPGRLPGTQHWLLTADVHSWAENAPADGDFLGFGELGASVRQDVGLASPLVLSRTPNLVSITVPRVIQSNSLWTSHGLREGEQYDDGTGDWIANGYLTREFERWNETGIGRLETALTTRANLQDFTSEGVTYPKMSAENGLARLVALLKSLGYQEVDW